MHAFTFRNDASQYGFSDPIAEYKAYYALGVDGVFSDFPDTALAAQAFERLTANVAALPIAGPGAEGIRRSLQQKLANAQRQADRGSNGGATGLLHAFINEVRGLPASRIAAADRQQLIVDAEKILMGL